ncbi:MAG: DUF547 domain-containing protein [Ignavibacteriae bacterium HGW-Ignavibacteriae-2]|nr:MAG: DUF547 domain-containing protein [Ignavibacteriae bacterium HGW-Ignavibacteriae-2]
MRSLSAIMLLIILYFQPANAQQHKLFSSVLQDCVFNGLVDYDKLKNDVRLDAYLHQLNKTNPETLTREEQLSFWINAYNSFTLKAIVDNYPVKSINDLHTGGLILGSLLKTTIWDDDFITINSNRYSLNDIEHNILREIFEEPRIHFAIVCASISCPPLRNEAFEANIINEQLNDQAILFLNDASRNFFDLKERTAHLSKIFDWFDEDFGDSDKKVMLYISKFLPDAIKKSILREPQNWNIKYKSYNWNLNKIN